jgi:hypothetical protein
MLILPLSPELAVVGWFLNIFALVQNAAAPRV